MRTNHSSATSAMGKIRGPAFIPSLRLLCCWWGGPGTGGDIRALLQGVRGGGESRVSEVEKACPGQRRARPGRACRQHAVEHVDPALDHLDDPLRVADAHEVPGVVTREERHCPRGCVE